MDIQPNISLSSVGDMIEAKKNAMALKAAITDEMDTVKGLDQSEQDQNKRPGEVYIKEETTFPDGDVAKKIYEYRAKTEAGSESYLHTATVTLPGEPEGSALKLSFSADISDNVAKYEHKESGDDVYTKSFSQDAYFFGDHKGRYVEKYGSETKSIDFNY